MAASYRCAVIGRNAGMNFYDKIELYELEDEGIPLRTRNYDWQKRNPNKMPLVTVGEQKIVMGITNAHYWLESGTDYTLLMKKGIKRTFYGVLELDVQDTQMKMVLQIVNVVPL